jgi:hypothetical protein
VGLAAVGGALHLRLEAIRKEVKKVRRCEGGKLGRWTMTGDGWMNGWTKDDGRRMRDDG